MKKGVDYIGVGVSAMIKNPAGKFLMAQRGKNVRNESGKWEFPGGGVEFGEKFEEAIVREIKEELNVDIQPLELVGAINHIIPAEKQHWVSLCLFSQITQGEPMIMEPDKCDEIGWFSLEEINNLPLALSAQGHLENFKKKFGQTKI